MGVKKALRSFVFLIVLVLALYFIANSITNYTGLIVGEINTEFERCLNEKDIRLYVEDYDMTKLKKFKTAEYLGSVEISGCVLNKIDCIKEGVIEYPSWVIEGESVVGDIEIYDLADLADCDMV